MAKSPQQQRHTDRVRAGRGSGKLDRDAARGRDVAPRDTGDANTPSTDELRDRLTRSRDGVIEQLRRLGISPERDDNAPRAGADTVLDEGDEAQASERQDLAYAARQRLVERVDRLTAALDRLHAGSYGRCSVCGEPIEPGRLAALPEAETCLRCQAQREEEEPDRAA